MRDFAAVCAVLCFGLVASGGETVSECRPLSGAGALWSKPDLRFVIVGEMHGTNETPAIFHDLICSSETSRRPIVVGLERPSREQKTIDAFMASHDHEAAIRDLVSEKDWNIFDGRSSRAMLTLLESLRVLALKGLVSEVVAFDDRHSDESSAQRESRMAAALMTAAGRHINALVIALTGNLHASKKPIARFGSYPFMAMLLPQTETISLLISDKGGEAWTQTSEGCGPHKLNPSGGENRGVFLSEVRGGYDGVLSTGSTASASFPAISDSPHPPACSKQ